MSNLTKLSSVNLMCNTHSIHHFHSFSACARYFVVKTGFILQKNYPSVMMQLSGCYPSPKDITTQLRMSIPTFVDPIFVSKEACNVLHDFLQDASRSGKFAVTAETYANTSVSCLKCLCRPCLRLPINLHHTPRNLARRQNSPWHWNRYKKLMKRLPTVYGISRSTTLPFRMMVDDYYGQKQAFSMCENLMEQVRRQKNTWMLHVLA